MKIRAIPRKVAGLFAFCLLLGVVSAQAANLTVTTTADDGVGSLRQALVDATANAAANVISFNVPTTDPGYSSIENRFTINLMSSLPDLPLAPLTIDNSQPEGMTVKGNDAFRIFTLVNSAVVTINNLTISNGFTGGLGGGIYMFDSSTLHLNRSTISGNSALAGGGIYINDSGTLNIDASTISGNTAVTNGAGVFNGTSGTINATSDTIDGNAAGGNGGGIYNTATITITNSTVSGNMAAKGGGIYNNFTATMNNNIVALNSAVDGNDLLGRGSLGIAFTGTYNLIGNADGSEGVSSGTNQVGSTETPIDARLGPLQDNGGPTFTRAIAYGSPAIDQGNSSSIISDQTGRPRPYDVLSISNAGNGADIGAFEVQLAPTSATVSIGGRVLTARGGSRGVAGATVFLTDLNGNIRAARTNGMGYYQFAEVQTNQTYFMNVEAKRFQFDAQAVTVVIELTDLDFFAL